VIVGPNPKWPLPRAMVDRYVAIATTTPANFHPFESSASLEDAVTRGGADGMPGVLHLALRGEVTRGNKQLDAEAPFGVAWLDVLLPSQPAR
jgi:hypothetical protein